MTVYVSTEYTCKHTPSGPEMGQVGAQFLAGGFWEAASHPTPPHPQGQNREGEPEPLQAPISVIFH